MQNKNQVYERGKKKDTSLEMSNFHPKKTTKIKLLLKAILCRCCGTIDWVMCKKSNLYHFAFKHEISCIFDHLL